MGIVATIQKEPEYIQTEIPSLRANFRWTFAGNIVYSLCQWGMLSVLAKLGTAAIVGQFALALAVAAPVFMFTNLQLRSVLATDAASEYQFSDYFSVRLIATLAGLLTIGIITLLIHCDVATRTVILLVAFARAVEAMSDVIAGLLQKYERLDRVSVSLILRGVFSFLTFGLCFVRWHSLVVAVIGMTTVWLFVLLGYDLRWAFKLIGTEQAFFRFEWLEMKRLFLLSLPLGVVISLASLNVNVPRYFLQHYGGAASLGIFAPLAYAVVAMNLVVAALSQAAITRLSKYFAGRAFQAFRTLVLKLAALGIVMIVVGVPAALLLGHPLLKVLYGPEYADHVGVLGLLVLVGGLNAIGAFIICGVSAARIFKPQVPVNVTVVVAGTLGCIFLIPKYQLLGAVLALLLASLVALSGAIWILNSALRTAERSV